MPLPFYSFYFFAVKKRPHFRAVAILYVLLLICITPSFLTALKLTARKVVAVKVSVKVKLFRVNHTSII